MALLGRVAVALLCLLLASPASAEQPAPVTLRAGADVHPLGHAITVLVDPAGNLSLADVREAARAGQMAAVRQDPPTFGFADGTFWFHAKVRRDGHPQRDWLLAIAYALLDEVDLHVVRGDGEVESLHSGDRRPFGERAVSHRHFTFAVPLAPGEDVELFLRVRSQSSVQVPLELTTREAFLARSAVEHLGLGVYYGIMLGLFCYNLILFAAIRDRTYLWYVVYVASFAASQLCLNGLAFEFLWPGSPDWANRAVLISIGVGMLAMLGFTRSYLDLPTRAHFANRVSLLVASVLVVAVAAHPWLGYRNTILIETGLVFVIAGFIVATGASALRQGFAPARNFMLAWGVMLAGTVCYAAVSFGLLPKMFLTEYGIQIGSAAEMVLLSFALADRINTLREENARIQHEHREQLEDRVRERTGELDEALQQLRHANQALRDFSLRDGLTGAHNRRHLDTALPDAWRRARSEGRPLALLMIDLDHFKRVNDEHGHLAGDDCLRAVAQVLIAQLRSEEAQIVRYGGEEFAVTLHGADAAQARAVGERLCRAVREHPVETEGARLALTVSIGLAVFAAKDPREVHELVREADRALYAAKRAGRDRVMTA